MEHVVLTRWQRCGLSPEFVCDGPWNRLLRLRRLPSSSGKADPPRKVSRELFFLASATKLIARLLPLCSPSDFITLSHCGSRRYLDQHLTRSCDASRQSCTFCTC